MSDLLPKDIEGKRRVTKCPWCDYSWEHDVRMLAQERTCPTCSCALSLHDIPSPAERAKSVIDRYMSVSPRDRLALEQDVRKQIQAAVSDEQHLENQCYEEREKREEEERRMKREEDEGNA